MTTASKAPVLDRILRDSMAFPGGVGEWLRDIERRGRLLQDRLAARSGGPAIRLLEEAAPDLDRALDDPATGVLHRLLRRPRHQLQLGSPALSAFSKYIEGVYGRVEGSLAVQDEVERVRTSVEALRAEFEGRLPHFTSREVLAARATSTELHACTSVQDALRAHRRLESARGVLRELLTAKTRTSEGERAGSTSDGATIDELCAALRVRMAERGFALPQAGMLTELRRLSDRHLDSLRRASGASDEASPAELLSEQLAQAIAQLDVRREHRGEDLPLRFGVAARAAGKVLQASRMADRPPVSAPSPTQPTVIAPQASSVVYVVPIGHNYVYLTREHVAAVRVSTAGGYRLGRELELRVFAPDGPDYPERLALLDIQPCFDGLDMGMSAWYRTGTGRRARVRIVGESNGAWFGVIVGRGVLERVKHPVWMESAPSPGAVRVICEGTTVSNSVVEVGEDGEAHPPAFGGFSTRRVATPRAEDARAWFRSTGDRLTWTQRRLGAELLFFTELHGRGGPGLVPLAEAKLGQEMGFLYRIPAAVVPDASPVLDDWLTESMESRIATLRSVARLVDAVHSSGYAIGLFHRASFAFAPSWSPGLATSPNPTPILVYAPFATAFGTPLPRPPISSAFERIAYTNLRYRGLPPTIIDKHNATPITDAAAFWIYALDHLLKRPLAIQGSWLGWRELTEGVEAGGRHRFDQPAFAARVARLLMNPDEWHQLFKLMTALARGMDWKLLTSAE